MQVKVEKDKIVIELPVCKRSSKSGKSTVIASTNGNIVSAATFEGKPITIGVNAYVK